MSKESGLHAALAKAQAKIGPLTRNREVEVRMKSGGAYKFKYATLDHSIEHVRKALSENGLWFFQRTAPGEIITTITHESGECVESAIPLPNLPNAPQEAGSILTYFRRYGFEMALGLAGGEDDDANVAQGNGYDVRGSQAQRQELPTPAKGWREPDNEFYRTPTALHRGLTHLSLELRRIGEEATFDDLEALQTSPEYHEFIGTAKKHALHYLEGGPPMPEEMSSLYQLEERARDLIALRSNQAMEPAQ